jgi:anti-sigma regulatory factor (Ser/Thr protein kinase)
MSAGEERRDDGRGPHTLVRPDHLVVWLRGIGDGAEPPVLLDDELSAPGFAVAEWTSRVREGYPEALACVVHDRSPATAEWLEDLDRLVRMILDGDARFTGDTLPTRTSRLRRWVRSTLAEHAAAADGGSPSAAVDDVVLAVDELVTNAGEHADGWVTVDLVPRPDGALVAVSDPAPEAPAVFRTVEPWHESGRGLLVVSQLSPIWGVLVARTMKTVWAWLPSEPAPAEPPVAE